MILRNSVKIIDHGAANSSQTAHVAHTTRHPAAYQNGRMVFILLQRAPRVQRSQTSIVECKAEAHDPTNFGVTNMIVSQQPSAEHIREEGDARHPHPSQGMSQLVAVVRQ
ncbi:hypothetical protein GB937_009863 [Aspergillus fischeri]|nr:hypothetical protein GB937_009863 [Aspergillus fischeri]